MDYETVTLIKGQPKSDADWAMRDCLTCQDRTKHYKGRCTVCGKN